MGNRRGNCVCEAVLRWFLPLRCHNLRIFYEYQESDRILIDHTAFCEDSKAKKDVLQSCYLWSSDFPELPSSTDPTDHNCSKRHCSKLEAVQKHCGCDVPPDQSLENMTLPLGEWRTSTPCRENGEHGEMLNLHPSETVQHMLASLRVKPLKCDSLTGRRTSTLQLFAWVQHHKLWLVSRVEAKTQIYNFAPRFCHCPDLCCKLTDGKLLWTSEFVN